MSNDNSRIETVEGDVSDIEFKTDIKGKEFVTVSITKPELEWPIKVRARDASILERMGNAKKQRDNGVNVHLGVEVRATPMQNGNGFFRDILSITSATIGDVVQEPAPPNGSTPAPRQQQAPSAPGSRGNTTIDQRIAWNSAINTASAKTPFNEEEIGWFEWVTIVDERAHLLTLLIERGAIPDKEARKEWWASYLNAPAEEPEGETKDSDGEVFEA